MKRLLIIFVIFFASPLWSGFEMGASAQVMVNKGAIIYSANDIIYVDGGLSNLKDTINGTGGTFRNSGSMYVTNGDFTNSAGNAAFTNTAGLNGASTINFFLNSPGPQDIKGNDVTEFYKLNLQGGGKKQLNGINAIVKDSLILNDLEFSTDVKTLYFTNPAVDAISRTSGFVSSLKDGAMVRSTNSSQPYLFPVGASTRYRPVEITPDNGSLNQFAVGMRNAQADLDAYPTGTKEANISLVNQSYYHLVRREPGGSATATITMYYDEATDGKFASMAHWQNAPQWEDIAGAPAGGKFGFTKSMVKQSWDFPTAGFNAFALIKLVNECGEMFVPNAFSPDNNGENDLEMVYGKCIQKIYFAIYDRWGEKVFETTDATRGWDGKYKGKELNTGVFVYYLTATLTTGEEIVKKGNISLFK